MTKKAHDKSNDFGWVIIEVERLCEDGFLDTFQIHDPFVYIWETRFSWCSGKVAKLGG